MSERILVVDDDTSLLQLLKQTLSNAGFDVDVANRVSQAIDLIEKTVPDLALIDVMMPEVDGITLCQRLREEPRTAHLPIIMLTARGQTTDKVNALETGADDYITKPVPQNELLARIRALLRRSVFSSQDTPRAEVTVWMGAKGGVGTSALVANVAVAMAETNERLILADWQPIASAASFLGLEIENGLDSLLTVAPEALSEAGLWKILLPHGSGLLLFPGSLSPTFGLRDLSLEMVDRLLDLLSAKTDRLFIDLGTSLDKCAGHIVQKSQRVIVVGEPDSLGIELADRLLRELNKLGMAGSRLGLVMVNRTGVPFHIPLPELTDHLRTPVLAVVTPAAGSFFDAVREKKPFVHAFPTSPVSDTFRTLARQLLSVKQPLR